MLRLCSLILFTGLCIDNCLVSALSFTSLSEHAEFPNPAFQNFLIQGRPKDQYGINSVRMKKLCSSRADSNSNEGIEDEELKREALDLLDCLTSATDENDPQFDVQKDMRRENMLLTNDYYDLKMELKERGLRTSGDKLEMITRILLHTIDPTIKYTDIAGAANQLKYVDEDDIAGEQVRVIPEAERTSSSSFFEGPDADDLAVLRPRLGQRPRRRSNNPEPSPLPDDPRDKRIGSDGTRDGGDVLQSSPNNVVGSASASKQSTDRASNASKVPRTPQQGAMSTSELMMMDGLTRREIQMDPVVVRRAVATAQVQDVRERFQREERPAGLTGSWTAGTRKVRERVKLQAYVAGGSKDVLKTWERHAAVIVLLPDERGWRSREMRILADEIAFSNQAIVIVPDIYRGEAISAESPAVFAAAAAGSAAESDAASRLPAVIDPLRRGSSKTLTAMSHATSQQQQIHQQKQQQLSSEEKRQKQQRFRAWEDKIDLDRVFDDILAAMAFVRNSYDARSISLAGVGYGAGRALEAGCALYDIAGACQWREIVLRQKQLDRQRAAQMQEQERLIKAALEQLSERGDPSPWTKSTAGSGAVVDDDRTGDMSAVELYSEHMGVGESESAEFARIDISGVETAVKVDMKPAANRSAPTVVKRVPDREEIAKGVHAQESSRKLTISSIDPGIVRDVAQKYSAHILRSRTASRYWGRTLDLGTGEDADTRMRNRAMGGEELQAMLEKMKVDEEEMEKFNATVAAATGAALGVNSESGSTAEGRAERNLWLEQQQFEYNRRISVDANTTSSSSGSGSSGSSSSTRDRSLNGDDGDAGSGAGAGSGGDVRGQAGIQAGMGAPGYTADDAFGGDEVLQELFGNATAVLERQQQSEESEQREQSERSPGDQTTGKSTDIRSKGEEKGAEQKSWRRLPSADEAVRAELKSLLRAHRRVQKRRSMAVTSSSRQAVGGGQQGTSDRAQLTESGAGVDASLERKQQKVREAVNQRLIESLLEDDESDSRRSATTIMEVTAKAKAQAQATKAAASLAHEYSFETLSMEEIATQLVPRACLALCPNRFDVAAVGNQIQLPVFLVYAANDTSPGARPIDALAMSEAMMRRSDDIFDFCVRSYSGRDPSFLLSTQTELDQRCRQEAIGAGSIWLDVFSVVNATELTDEAGRTKHTAQAFVTVDPDRDLRPPPGFRNFGTSPVATYLHDDPFILFPESTSAS